MPDENKNPSPRQWLVTGNAGFIGFQVAKELLERGETVIGFDIVNDYYDPTLKEARLRVLEDVSKKHGSKYVFFRENLADSDAVNICFEKHRPDRVVHLAAQAGVRYSLINPQSYVESNLVGFTNILEACRYAECEHLVYASSSSVYGGNTKLPSSTHSSADHPLQFYAATKRANEMMAHAYSHLYKLPSTALRFFTVYGPWGRPDMALFKFTKNILANEPIDVFNYGNHSRDFTYVDDVVESIIRVADKIPEANPDWDSQDPDFASSNVPYRILNIGNNSPTPLKDYISAIEDCLGMKAIHNNLPMQPGDIPDTFADSSELAKLVDFKPQTAVKDGVRNFVDWYMDYYKVERNAG